MVNDAIFGCGGPGLECPEESLLCSYELDGGGRTLGKVNE